MRVSTVIFLVAAVFIGWVAPGSAVPDEPPKSALILDGEWEGTLRTKGRVLTGYPGEEDFTIRLSIDGNTAEVYMLRDGDWSEVKPNAFKIERHGPNAVIYAIDSGGNGGWVETWVFAVTPRSHGELLVQYLRVVNNLTLPLLNPNSKFGYSASGTFKRSGLLGV